MQIINKRVEELRAYDKNPRRNDDAVEYVANSIREFGFKVPVVIDEHDTIVCGHTRVKAAVKLGMGEVPCIVADDLTPEQIKAFRLADNKVGELAMWDWDLLSDEMEELDELGIDMSDFGFLSIDDDEEPQEAPQDLSDEVKEVYEVIIECGSELEQESVYYKLTQEGYKCRVLTL
jgi:ParB-like chromosome segregation protein Spo0J